jgi:hypothetical protein
MKLTLLRKVVKRVGCVAVGIFASVALMSKVDARTIGAFTGLPIDNSNDITCFRESSGAVTGTGLCVGTPFPDSPRWEVQLPVDTYGAKHVYVSMKGTGSTGATCYVYTFDQYSNYLGTSNGLTVYSSSYQVGMIDSANIPTNGYMFLACGNLTSPSIAVGSITWTP